MNWIWVAVAGGVLLVVIVLIVLAKALKPASLDAGTDVPEGVRSSSFSGERRDTPHFADAVRRPSADPLPSDSERHRSEPSQPIQVSSGDVSAAVSPQVIELIQQDRTIAAIKQVREETGLGLAEAKRAVEGIQAAMRSGFQMPSGASSVSFSTQTTTRGQGSFQVSPQVLELIRGGDLIRAIKQVRDDHGLGLAEAKRVVEAIRDSPAGR